MNLLLTTILSFLLLASCGETKSGKRRRIFFPKMKTHSNNEVTFKSIKGKEMSVALENEGHINKNTFTINKKRYLREKILHQAFLNLREGRNKEHLQLTLKDELRFYPGGVEIQDKSKVESALSLSQSPYGSWKFDGSLSLGNVGKESRLKNIVVGLGSFLPGNGRNSSFGQDLLRSRDGQALEFKGEQIKDFSLSYSDIPHEVMGQMLDINSSLYLEVYDFELNDQSLKEYNYELRKNKTRLIISLPDGEARYFIRNGENLYTYLKKIDSSVRLNYQGKLLSLFTQKQDDMFTYTDRNVLNNFDLLGDKKIWWSNLKKPIDEYEANGKTIVLSFMSLDELRATQLLWEKLNFKIENNISLNQFDSVLVMGKIIKTSIEYKIKKTFRVIPLEIGTKECSEDNRFERKGADCYIKWRASFSNPLGEFKKQMVSEGIQRKLIEGEVTLKGKSMNTDFTHKGEGILALKNLEKPNAVKGGFVGWREFDPRLNAYQIRAPYDDLSPVLIKQGFSNQYEFRGWKLIYPYGN